LHHEEARKEGIHLTLDTLIKNDGQGKVSQRTEPGTMKIIDKKVPAENRI
jgi:hypothetical protein